MIWAPGVCQALAEETQHQHGVFGELGVGWGGGQIVRKKTCRSGKLQSPKSELFPQSSSSGGYVTGCQDPRP